MQDVSRTWISSTLATEFVALAAAKAALEVVWAAEGPSHLERVGGRLYEGLRRLHARYPQVIDSLGGMPEMCLVRYLDDGASQGVARECVRRGLLFKRTAYNFVSLAHDEARIDWTLGVLEEALFTVARSR